MKDFSTVCLTFICVAEMISKFNTGRQVMLTNKKGQITIVFYRIELL